jgi:hypothetical protein
MPELAVDDVLELTIISRRQGPRDAAGLFENEQPRRKQRSISKQCELTI